MRFLSFALVLALSATTFDSMAGRIQMCGDKITTEAGSITFSELIFLSDTYKSLVDKNTDLAGKLASLSNRYKALQAWNIGLTVGLVGVAGCLIYEKCTTATQAEE